MNSSNKQVGIVNAMTVDVEDWFQVQALSGAIHRDSWDGRELRVEQNTGRLLQLFDERGIRATFFVLGWVAERRPNLVRRIAEAGHELACHGFSHRLVFDQSPDEFRQEADRSRKLIEDASGQRVRGYRAATYSITARSLWALDVLAELGFDYDSSIFPVRHDTYGIPGAGRWPGKVQTPKGRDLVEFPMTTARYAGFNLPVCGGGYFRLLPYWLNHAGLTQINEQEKQPFVFYLHPWEIDPGQPKIRTSLLSSLRHYTNLDAVERRLTRLMGEFSFGAMEDVLKGRGLLA